MVHVIWCFWLVACVFCAPICIAYMLGASRSSWEHERSFYNWALLLTRHAVCGALNPTALCFVVRCTGLWLEIITVILCWYETRNSCVKISLLCEASDGFKCDHFKVTDGDLSCRFCRTEQHIVCCCEALARQRYVVFGEADFWPKRHKHCFSMGPVPLHKRHRVEGPVLNGLFRVAQ